MIITPDHYFVFDLDDTLYKEQDYLFSAFRHISEVLKPELGKGIYEDMIKWYQDGKRVFNEIVSKYNPHLNLKEMVNLYRLHNPSLELASGNKQLLDFMKSKNYTLGLMTDGRSKTQRAKIKALGIEDYFDNIVISEEIGSEKPSQKNYKSFMDNTPHKHFVYCGDNIKKDFISANFLGWKTIGVRDNGQNIHSQKIEVPKNNMPDIWIDNLVEIKNYLV